jgi:hypothetical protein
MIRGAWLASAAIGISTGSLASADAAAGDGIRPRTPVVWPADVPCSVRVDRSVAPIVHLAYEIAVEDPPAGEAVTDDEVADGRRHQFFAFASDIDPRIAMPDWITMADVDAAAELDLVDPAAIEADAVLEAHSVLAATFLRIDADDARRPITFAAADAGVDWDTTGLATGGWVVRAYTWDPWPNRWAAPRPGVVVVGDGPDAADHAPALAISIEDDVLYRDELGTITGCVAAMDGTTVTAEWTFFDEPAGEWQSFATDEPLAGDALVLAFAPPEPLWGRFAVIRVTATDPMDRSWTAYLQARVTVLASDTPADCDAVPSSCDTSDGGSSGSSEATAASETTVAGEDESTGNESTSTGVAQDDPRSSGGSGCSCAADHRDDSVAAAALGGIVCVFARRRRSRHRR